MKDSLPLKIFRRQPVVRAQPETLSATFQDLKMTSQIIKRHLQQWFLTTAPNRQTTITFLSVFFMMLSFSYALGTLFTQVVCDGAGNKNQLKHRSANYQVFEHKILLLKLYLD